MQLDFGKESSQRRLLQCTLDCRAGHEHGHACLCMPLQLAPLQAEMSSITGRGFST